MFVAGVSLFVGCVIVLLFAGVTADGTDNVHRRDMCGQWMGTAVVGILIAILMIVAAVAKHVSQ